MTSIGPGTNIALVGAGARVADEIEPLDRTDRHGIIDPGGTVLLLTPPSA